jgi:nitrate/TMAO reductase-like tetraheme cytochrome c subunit
MSGIGAALATLGLAVLAFQLLLEQIVGGHSGYAGLALLPALGLGALGTSLVVVGWLRERRRQRRGERSSFYDTWVVDPWAVVRRRGLWFVPLVVAAGGLVLLGVSAGTFGVVEYSESNTFCTQACHSVMGPEAMAYQDTAHSRVPCVQCHVGAGPEGFLAAKLGGLRQLYALATDSVARPIPTPIHGGRIDRELCESCHAAERDAGVEARAYTYFLSGEDVDPVRVAMILKVGGISNGIMPGEGVHYHMQISRRVEYVARDARRNEIAWVRVTEQDGTQREYESDSSPLSDDERAALKVHAMDCIDCHSRPAHRFAPATETVNRALEAGLLSRDLPSIKEVAVSALDGGYETTADALVGIEEHLREFYEEEYPEVVEDRSDELDAGIATLRTLYRRTIFPEMKADWRAHPDRSGHLDAPGCFRCHNDEMLDADGDAIPLECSSCHAVLAQDDETIETMEEFEVGRPFEHPEDGSTFDEFSLCSDCHTGGAELYE